MAARCSHHSTDLVLPSVPRIGIPPAVTHIVHQHGSPLNLLRVEDDSDLIAMDFLHPHRLTQHLIGASTGNYIASPVPSSEDAATNPVPPPLPPSSSSSPSPSPLDRRIPRACNGVERRKRSHPSPPHGGADYRRLAKLTRTERAALKAPSSRRISFAEHAHQIAASSSLWTATDGARRTTTSLVPVNGKPKPKRQRHRAPTPTPTPVPPATTRPSLERASLGGGYAREGDSDTSLGFYGDVDDSEFEPASASASANLNVARRELAHVSVSAKERLTITVPGGKSEAYVAMAFERSCSLADEDEYEVEDDNDASAVHHHPASSWRISDDAASEYPRAAATHTDRAESEAGYSRPSTPTHWATMSSLSLTADINMTMMTSRDQIQDHNPIPPLAQIGRTAFSRTPIPTPAATPEGRAERRVARRAALAPYYAIDRLRTSRLNKRPGLIPC